MSIAYDSSAQGGISGAGVLTFNHTCTGSELYLFVALQGTASGVTYNGVAMTLITTYTPVFPPGTNCPPIQIWGLGSPATGINVVSITANAAASAISVSYTGCNTVQPDSYNQEDSANNQVTTFTGTATSVTDNCWILGFYAGANNNSRSLNAHAGSTLRQANVGTLFAGQMSIIDTNAAKTPAGAYTTATDWSVGSGFVTSISIALRPPYAISKTETVSIVATPNVAKGLNISKSDAVTLSESRSLAFVSLISISDSVALTESKTVFSPLYNIVKSDSVTTTEMVYLGRYPNPRFGIVELQSESNDWPLGMDDETIL